MNPTGWLAGWRTYFAAIGLVGLAVYQASQGDWHAAYTSLMAALAAFGLRQAIARTNGGAGK